MSDQELDDLFKEASAKYEAPFDEKEWEKMAALLDSPPSPKPGFWNWKIISGLALLLLISGTVLITQWNNTNGSVESKGNQPSKIIAPSKEEVSSSKANDTKKAESNENLSSKDAVTESAKENNSIIKSNNTEQESVSSQSANSSSSPSLSAKRTSGKEGNEQLKTKTLNESKIQKKELITEKVKENNASAASFDKKNNRQQQASTTTVSNSTSDKINSTKNASVLAAQQSTNKKSKASGKESVVINSDKVAVIVSTNSKNEKGRLKADEIAANGNDNISNEKESVSLLKGSNPITNANEEQKESSSVTAILNNSSERNENDSDKLLSSSASLNKASLEKSSDSSIVAASPIKKDSAMNKEVAKKKERKKSDSTKIDRFSVKLALSPDFSSIGYFKPGKTGFNYGLLAEYNITRHWSVTLGGIWSRKIYTGTMTENAGYGTVNSTYIDGSCRVLDLPLNINYYIMPQNAFSLYGSVGLSSYFMFDEDYTYDYVYGTKQYSYSKKINRGNTEWFRMMNLSIGIQQQLSPRMRLQLEPFIKAPLSGIGGGDLKLVSSGVFLNIKYTFK